MRLKFDQCIYKKSLYLISGFASIICSRILTSPGTVYRRLNIAFAQLAVSFNCRSASLDSRIDFLSLLYRCFAELFARIITETRHLAFVRS